MRMRNHEGKASECKVTRDWQALYSVLYVVNEISNIVSDSSN